MGAQQRQAVLTLTLTLTSLKGQKIKMQKYSQGKNEAGMLSGIRADNVGQGVEGGVRSGVGVGGGRRWNPHGDQERQEEEVDATRSQAETKVSK